MSQTLIVTTPDQLKDVLASIIGQIPAAQIPAAVVEIEVLKRKEWLTPDEVVKVYPLNANTMAKDRANGKGPAFSKLGEKVVYSHTAIRKYLESRRQKTYE